MPKLVSDYYKVVLPIDMEDFCDLPMIAIDQARERARLYCVPTEWVAKEVLRSSWEIVFRVRRRRNRCRS